MLNNDQIYDNQKLCHYYAIGLTGDE